MIVALQGCMIVKKMSINYARYSKKKVPMNNF
jgi:hypothetical protein